jgi:hypothetical protein
MRYHVEPDLRRFGRHLNHQEYGEESIGAQMALQVFFTRPEFFEHERTLFLNIPVEPAADAALLEFGLLDHRFENDQRLFVFFWGDDRSNGRMNTANGSWLVFSGEGAWVGSINRITSSGFNSKGSAAIKYNCCVAKIIPKPLQPA